MGRLTFAVKVRLLSAMTSLAAIHAKKARAMERHRINRKYISPPRHPERCSRLRTLEGGVCGTDLSFFTLIGTGSRTFRRFTRPDWGFCTLFFGSSPDGTASISRVLCRSSHCVSLVSFKRVGSWDGIFSFSLSSGMKFLRQSTLRTRS